MNRAATAYRAGASAIVILTLADFVLLAGARFHDLSLTGMVDHDVMTDNAFDGFHWLTSQALTPMLAVVLVVLGAVVGARALLVRAVAVIAVVAVDVALWSMAPSHPAFGSLAGLASVGVFTAAIWACSASAMEVETAVRVAHPTSR